jgi:hypothetical protein
MQIGGLMLKKKDKLNASGLGATYGIDPEALDFSNDTWSWKGDIPNYPIQSDGFSYDVIDKDGNDKTALSLGILGMIIILFNVKSPKIKEEDILPIFTQVAATRNWHKLSNKEINFLSKTAISKLVNTETSSDVFDLASYAPLEVKRALLKKLFVAARFRLKPEYREEAERRIVEDIVPLIFSNPEYELALLTGLIVKPKGGDSILPQKEVVSGEEPDEIDREPIDSEPEPIEQNAEEALQNHLETLRREVPNPIDLNAEPHESSGYVPFSDMEKEQLQQASQPPVSQPSMLQPGATYNGQNQQEQRTFSTDYENVAKIIPQAQIFQSNEPIRPDTAEPKPFGFDSLPYQPQNVPANQPRAQVPPPNLQDIPKPPLPTNIQSNYPVPPAPAVPEYFRPAQPPQPMYPAPGYPYPGQPVPPVDPYRYLSQQPGYSGQQNLNGGFYGNNPQIPPQYPPAGFPPSHGDQSSQTPPPIEQTQPRKPKKS